MKNNLCATLFSVALCLGSSVVAVGQQQIAAGSKVYIEPMNGFETYMAAAIEKKKVPLVVVSDESVADYVMTGNPNIRRPDGQKLSSRAISTPMSRLAFPWSARKPKNWFLPTR